MLIDLFDGLVFNGHIRSTCFITWTSLPGTRFYRIKGSAWCDIRQAFFKIHDAIKGLFHRTNTKRTIRFDKSRYRRATLYHCANLGLLWRNLLQSILWGVDKSVPQNIQKSKIWTKKGARRPTPFGKGNDACLLLEVFVVEQGESTQDWYFVFRIYVFR